MEQDTGDCQGRLVKEDMKSFGLCHFLTFFLHLLLTSVINREEKTRGQPPNLDSSGK